MRRKRPTVSKTSSVAASPARREPRVASDDDQSLKAAPFVGYVDLYGYSSAAGGWLFSGWVPRPLNVDAREPVEFLAQYEKGQSWGQAILAFHQRDDLDQRSIGVIAFVRDGSPAVGHLQSIAFS